MVSACCTSSTETLNLSARSGRKWPIYTINRQTEKWYIKDNVLHSVVNFNCLQTTHFEGWLWPENLIDCYTTVWRTTWPQYAANWPQLDKKSTPYWRHSRRHRKLNCSQCSNYQKVFRRPSRFHGKKPGSPEPLLRPAFSRSHRITKGSGTPWIPHNFGTDCGWH